MGDSQKGRPMELIHLSLGKMQRGLIFIREIRRMEGGPVRFLITTETPPPNFQVRLSSVWIRVRQKRNTSISTRGELKSFLEGGGLWRAD